MSSSIPQQAVASQPGDLVCRIGQGDAEAERLLVARYQRPLLEVLRYRTGDPELARDLLQDTLVIIINRLRGKGLEEPHKLAAFMHRTAHNLVISHFRKEARRRTEPDTELVETLQDVAAGQVQNLIQAEASEHVQRLLEGLRTPRDREILLRFYVKEHTKPDICQALDLSPAQFDRVINRARNRFRRLVEESERLE